MINDILTEMVSESRTCSHVAELTNEIHVYPDYHGNRSPIADPTLRGMVSADYAHLLSLYDNQSFSIGVHVFELYFVSTMYSLVVQI